MKNSKSVNQATAPKKKWQKKKRQKQTGTLAAQAKIPAQKPIVIINFPKQRYKFLILNLQRQKDETSGPLKTVQIKLVNLIEASS